MLEAIIYIADFVLILVSGVMIWQLHRGFRNNKAPKYAPGFKADAQIPSVSVCIPARNEQHALTDCLQRVLNSTYPKLEILVLDDDSVDNTPALINSFASEGVRFIKGAELTDDWIGKNLAHQRLLEEASGTYVLFLDVDTVLTPTAIENMVKCAQESGVTMLSVLPRREDNWRFSVVASTMRYFWEMIFNRRLSPATVSNAWLIKRESFLTHFDGFKTMKKSVQLEVGLAADLAKNDDYRFIISTKEFGVSIEKKWRSQLATGVRIVFPILGKQIALASVAIIDLAVFLVPFIVVATYAMWPETHTPLIYVNLLLCLIYCGIYGYFAKHVWNKGWVLGALLWPFLVIQEIIVIIVSVFKYQRSTVEWKGRPIQPEVQS